MEPTEPTESTEPTVSEPDAPDNSGDPDSTAPTAQPEDPHSSDSGNATAQKQKAAKVLFSVAAGAPPVSGGICLALYLLKAKGLF